jgi:tellurite resistance protein TerC
MIEHTIGTPALWSGFIIFVLVMLALDLGVFHRREHEVSLREALLFSVMWIALALIFNLGVWRWYGTTKALEFFTGYLVEKALSVDNIFVFIVLFRYFAVPRRLHHRVLFFGILGALVMRAVFILLGAAIIERFHVVIYLLGALLVVTGVKLLRESEISVEPEKNLALRLFRRLVPSISSYRGSHFFVREGEKLWATPLLGVLIAVETTDLAFAVDSIPAIFAITTDPFIVFTSNIFAILGLRALYFLLAGAMEGLRYLRFGLATVLVFIGAKMLIGDIFEIPIQWSLIVVITVLGVATLASLLNPRRATSA